MKKHYLVTKSNHFIKNSAYDLSLEEQRIILTLASMVQPNDREFKKYIFKVSDFIELLGVKTENKYSKLPAITKELMKKVFEIEDINKQTLTQLAWLSAVTYEKNTGEIIMEFNPRLKPYLLELKGFYTQYKLSNILSMKSKYSPRIYELLKMNEFNKKGFIISVEELRKMFKAENIYPLYADFKRKIIEQAQKELQEFSDIRFDFEEIKHIRKIESIKFIIKSNVPTSSVESKIIKTNETPIKDSKKIKETKKLLKEHENQEKKFLEKEEKINPLLEIFNKKSKKEQLEIEKKAYEIYLEESAQDDSLIQKDIFKRTKTKNSFILKIMENLNTL